MLRRYPSFCEEEVGLSILGSGLEASLDFHGIGPQLQIKRLLRDRIKLQVFVIQGVYMSTYTIIFATREIYFDL